MANATALMRTTTVTASQTGMMRVRLTRASGTTPRDGIGDNSDLDDDNDGWSDAEEDECGTDQYDSDSTPVDYDSNGVCDANDPIVEPEPDGTPGFGLLSALTVLALAAFARRD